MTELYEFMGGSPYLTFFIVVGVGLVIELILKYCVNRPLRAMNIRKHGWPPPHCDADGDFKPKEKSDD